MRHPRLHKSVVAIFLKEMNRAGGIEHAMVLTIKEVKGTDEKIGIESP